MRHYMVRHMFQIFKKNKGFALPTAIFILVVLSLLGTTLLSINSYNQKSGNLNLLETKAYFAAKTGAEYGVYQAVKNNICLNGYQTIDLSGNYFIGFKSSYNCVETSVDEAGIVQKYYKINSNGCNTLNLSCPDGSGNPSREDYVEKSITIIASKN